MVKAKQTELAERQARLEKVQVELQQQQPTSIEKERKDYAAKAESESNASRSSEAFSTTRHLLRILRGRGRDDTALSRGSRAANEGERKGNRGTGKDIGGGAKNLRAGRVQVGQKASQRYNDDAGGGVGEQVFDPESNRGKNRVFIPNRPFYGTKLSGSRLLRDIDDKISSLDAQVRQRYDELLANLLNPNYRLSPEDESLAIFGAPTVSANIIGVPEGYLKKRLSEIFYTDKRSPFYGTGIGLGVRKRAILAIREDISQRLSEGDESVRASFVNMDITNLGGVTNFFTDFFKSNPEQATQYYRDLLLGEAEARGVPESQREAVARGIAESLGHSFDAPSGRAIADFHLAKLFEIVRKNLSAASDSAVVEAFRQGGDEFSFVVLNAEHRAVQDAIARSYLDLKDYLSKDSDHSQTPQLNVMLSPLTLRHSLHPTLSESPFSLLAYCNPT